MQVADLCAGWRSDFILHEQGALIAERADCIAVRTPGSPTFYWGNCLYLPAAPADGELAHWEARFHDEIAAHQPESLHAAFGINAAPRDEQLPAWAAAGYETLLTAVLEIRPGQLRAPARAARGDFHVRAFDLRHELELAVELQCADIDGYEPAGYALHRRRQMQRMAAMAEQGLAQWFGLWCGLGQESRPVADCGLMRSGAEAGGPDSFGRFQHVSTHPQFRRRGYCSALIHAVTAWGFEHWQLERALMCADPDDVAIGIYESLGYQRIADEWGLQRRAPQDRVAAVVSA